ncbi:MAG TPA: ArgE/DapE family deacylase [bacterium]|nr:ArgE/DapE family deacylase [bacterium]
MPDAELTRKILDAVERRFDEQVEFTAELVRQPSVRGAEHTVQDVMAGALRERGYAVDRWRIEVEEIAHLPGFSPVHADYANAWNVVGAHRSRSSQGRSLILNGHVDVVPVGPLDMWDTPPFAPRVEEGWMYGRGAGDMKAGLAGCLYALDSLRALGLQPAADVYVQSVVEEECTGNGALACLQRGYRADAALIPEPLGEALVSAQVGVIWFQVKLKGRPVHVAYAGTGANAIEAAWPIIQALHGLEADWNSADRRHPAWREEAHPINLNIGRIAGGDWASSVPAWCTFDVRIAVFPGQDLAAARREIEDCVRLAAQDNPFLADYPPEIVYHGFLAEGYELSGADEPTRVLGEAHRACYGESLRRVPTTATTDARFYGLYAGIPALVYGPTSESIHGFNERVNLESVRRNTQTMALFIADWCGLEPV